LHWQTSSVSLDCTGLAIEHLSIGRSNMKLCRFLILAAITGASDSVPARAQMTGPSTATEPYVLPTMPGVTTVSILTSGDAVDGYRLVGIPDGTGLFEANATTYNLVTNHELPKSQGDEARRAHGSKGAFVSRWLVEKATGKILAGRDHLAGPQSMMLWNGAYVAGTTALDRLCSADLAKASAYLDGEAGTAIRMLLSGEETSETPEGRVFAHVLAGPNQDMSFELPHLGKMSFENAVANPFQQQKTIVMLNDDASVDTDVAAGAFCRRSNQSNCVKPPSELYVYVGTKQSQGNEIERAGLGSGRFYGVRVVANGAPVPGEHKDLVFATGTAGLSTAGFELVDFGDVSGKTGAEIEDDSIAARVTQFMRVEDGAWDPRPGKERDYYFTTTGNLATTVEKWRPSRLWRLRFDDITRPEAGGTIEMLLTNQFYEGTASTPDADPSYQMLDNLAIDGLGRIVLQEDVGPAERLARIYVYGIDSGKLQQIAVNNQKFFGGSKETNPSFLTHNAESSGVVDAAELLGPGWFHIDVQSHVKTSDPELVGGGQLLRLYIDPAIGR
jgi:hypothetical protein